MNNDDLFWEASVEDLARGYSYDEQSKTYSCLICHQVFEKGIIYPYGQLYLEAERAARQHMTDEHVSMFHYLIQLNKRFTGLSDQQRTILPLFYEGLSDKEVVEAVEGVGSISTVRQYRFKLKEKVKQAKTFMAIMTLLEKQNRSEQQFMPIHKGATMVDERYAITTEEQEKFISTYFTEKGTLKEFPKKEKRKIIILNELVKRYFKAGKKYTEKEVNAILKPIYPDFVTIRRYLIEYGFLDRHRDGTAYWVKQ
jgi:hypothetical protein